MSPDTTVFSRQFSRAQWKASADEDDKRRLGVITSRNGPEWVMPRLGLNDEMINLISIIIIIIIIIIIWLPSLRRGGMPRFSIFLVPSLPQPPHQFPCRSSPLYFPSNTLSSRFNYLSFQYEFL
ncbi:hypothetical protein ElyMa_003085400 [Elysia marginata]|uniref:Uncharacterized protein n=1 Tax=Elysia marginata TaxID=1093978 RepID=A0AAV4IRU1_9GAST|nr:hypothetical protein ElyMa_003085400 [Elysia marginata]